MISSSSWKKTNCWKSRRRACAFVSASSTRISVCAKTSVVRSWSASKKTKNQKDESLCSHLFDSAVFISPYKEYVMSLLQKIFPRVNVFMYKLSNGKLGGR